MRKFLHAKHRNWAVSASLVEDRAGTRDYWLLVHRCNRSVTLPPRKAKTDGENQSHVQHAKEKRVRIGHDWYSFWLVDNRARSFLANQKAWLCKQSKRQFHSAENGCESLKVDSKLTLKKWKPFLNGKQLLFSACTILTWHLAKAVLFWHWFSL